MGNEKKEASAEELKANEELSGEELDAVAGGQIPKPPRLRGIEKDEQKNAGISLNRL